MCTRTRRRAARAFLGSLLFTTACRRAASEPEAGLALADTSATPDGPIIDTLAGSDTATNPPDGLDGAGVDAAPPLSGDWQMIDVICGGSRAWLALAPSKVAVDTWDACASGRPGCERLKTPWSSGIGAKLKWGGVGVIGSQQVLAYTRLYAGAGEAIPSMDLQIIETHEGTILAAVALDYKGKGSSCSTQSLFGSFGLVYPSSTTGAAQFSLFAAASLPKPSGKWSVTWADVASPPTAVTNVAIGDSFAFLQTYEPGGVLTMELATGLLSEKVTAATSPAYRPVAFRNSALALNQHDIFYIDAKGARTRLHTVTVGRELIDLQIDRATESVVWVDGKVGGLGATDLVLWRAALVSNAGIFVPKRVTGLASPALEGLSGGTVLVNDGLVAVKFSDTELRVYRLEDGKGWALTPEASDRWTVPFSVNKVAVWVGVDLASAKSQEDRGLVRQRLADLGSTTISPL